MRSEESWLLSVSFSSTSSQSTWNSFIPLFSQGIQKRALLYNLGNKSIACEGYVVLYFVHCQFNQIKFPMLVLFFLLIIPSVQFSCSVLLFVTPWTAARQASLPITNSRSLLKLMPIESVMPSNHLILCRPLLLPPSVFPNIRVFSNESVLCIRWPKFWNFSFNISPSNEYSGQIYFRIDVWI